MVNYVCVYNESVKSKTERPQHDRPVVCVIAQQYSSVTVSLCFHSRNEKYGARLKKKKMYYLDFFFF
jgi:hypothetical protein